MDGCSLWYLTSKKRTELKWIVVVKVVWCSVTCV